MGVVNLSFCLIIVFSFVKYTGATIGVDVSGSVSQSTWSCLAQQVGVQFMMMRGYMSYGAVDPNAAATISNAQQAGIQYTDMYIFPCVSCGNPGGQVSDAINNLVNSGVNFGMVWLDIEVYQWGSQSDNIAFIQGMVNQAKNMGYGNRLGIYTNLYNWNTITGGSTQFSNLPLWYAHYDYNPSFSDFTPFGGWTKPAIKQYAGDSSYCSADVDMNYY